MNRRQFADKKGLRKIKGQVMIMVGLWLTVLLMFAALTIEIGRLLIVRNELQNAADSAALQGASYLYPSTNQPNWSLAQSEALSAIPNNKVEKVTLSNGTITTGYWNLTTSTMKSDTSTPIAGDVPAVKVTISKSAGNNGGPVNLYFGSLLGMPSVNLSATAVAVSGSPAGVNANELFPIAMAKSLYDSYWDSINNTPKIDPLTGNPYIFQINSGPQGGWTSFLQQLNDTPSVRALVSNGNPTPLSIGQNIYFSPGVKTDIYSYVPTNKDVFVAITSDTTPGSFGPIVAFGALHIDFAVGGSSKYIQVQFTTNLKIPSGEPGGPSYGLYTPARLAN